MTTSLQVTVSSIIFKILSESSQFSSVQFSQSVMSNSLRPHESQHARSPCPSLTPGIHSDSHPSSQWCHPAISPSVIPFSSCPQSLPASESLPISQLLAWDGQSTGVSASASFLLKNTVAIYTVAIFLIATTWKQQQCPSTEEWIKKLGTYTQWNITQSQKSENSANCNDTRGQRDCYTE